MTEHKYTDEEVIKALECCDGTFAGCEQCPMRKYRHHCNIKQQALDLINRKKAEVAFWMDAAANAKKEAVKEFAEKVKEYAEWYTDDNCSFDYIPLEDIDNAVKEFTEEKT